MKDDVRQTVGELRHARRTRVLMIAPAGSGGTLQYAHNLCNSLAVAGDAVILATGIDSEVSAFPRTYELLGVFDQYRLHPGPVWRFLRRVRRFRPQIVHFQGAQQPRFYALMIWLLDRICQPHFVWTPQDIVSNSARPSHARMQTANYARMQHVFLNARQNETALRDLYRVPPDRISVLPIPDLVSFARKDLGRAAPAELAPLPDGPIVLCFGLIEPRKGIGTLISAFGRIAARHPDATLVVMGKALTDVAPYISAARALGLAETRIRIIARYASFEEMNGLFEAATMVVLPYVNGWNSGVVASAFGYARPVLATRVGGFEEVIRDGDNGLLVPPEDPQALAEAMARLLADDRLRARLRDGARTTAQQSSWDAVAAETRHVYAAVAGREMAHG